MRVAVATSLLLLLFLQTMVLSPWMELSIRLHKERVENRLSQEDDMEEEDLQKLSFSLEAYQNELAWENEKEFEYQGSMYDVLEQDQVDDKIVLTVYRDEEETELRERQRAFWKGKEEKEDEGSQRNGNIHPFKYLRTKKAEIQEAGSASFLGLKPTQTLHEKGFLEILTPPPC